MTTEWTDIGAIQMTFEEWIKDQPDGYYSSAEIFKAGAASRDAEIAKLKDDNEYLYVAAIERDQLRAELATALAACKAKDEAILQENYSLALSFQPDTAALEAIVKKAGEVMRERVLDPHLTRVVQGSEMIIADAIRALPAVTLEDLK